MKHLQSATAMVAQNLLTKCALNQQCPEHNNKQPQGSRTKGLDRIDESNIAESLDPILAELTAIDAESFLTLDRVVDEGADLQPGYDFFSTYSRSLHTFVSCFNFRQILFFHPQC